MADRTKIEWTDATWNPISGCAAVSRGCDNCYAARMAHRMWGRRHFANVAFHEERLLQPLRWRTARRIFVCSMGDLFHERVTDEWIDAVMAVIVHANGHTFQVLTKRPERMLDYARRTFGDPRGGREIAGPYAVIEKWREIHGVRTLDEDHRTGTFRMRGAPGNLWLGVSVEDQATADARVPLLLQTPAARRFVSCEPLLGAVDMRTGIYEYGMSYGMRGTSLAGIDLLIAGGESGPGARPMHPDWARGLRGQCAAAGVPFFFKGWGEWAPGDHGVKADVKNWREFQKGASESNSIVNNWRGTRGEVYMARVGKRAAGHLLDGREWREMPR